MKVGRVVGGTFDKILVRQAEGCTIQIGDLLKTSGKILQVNDIEYAPTQNQVLWGRMGGEIHSVTDFIEQSDTIYTQCSVKSLCDVAGNTTNKSKTMPTFLGEIYSVEDSDFDFLPNEGFFVGHVRSGSKVLNTEVRLPIQDVFSHHVLIPATTGRGKSNLVKVILSSLLESRTVGVLILDAHDEYARALEGEGKAYDNLVVIAEPGIGLSCLKPWHLDGIVDLTDAQERAVWNAHRDFGDKWLETILDAEELPDVSKKTLPALRSKLKRAVQDKAFSRDGAENRVVDAVCDGKVVVLNTSKISDKVELLVMSVLADLILKKHQAATKQGSILPVASIVLEEAPSVLGRLEGGNIFTKIAREGRKFGVGLVAITQLASMIDKTILANMNTKIILGNEMEAERKAIVESASQDLSEDKRNIASLDKGEAIITSVFVPFAIPVKIPLHVVGKPSKPNFAVIG